MAPSVCAFQMMVPRISYFPFIMDKVTRHFSRSVAESNRDGKDLWIDSDGQPLRMHYPIGLLWDLIGSTTSTLPWNLTVHFSNFPEEELVRCSSRPAMEAMFINVVKEADSLKHRGDIMTNLMKKDHLALQSGLFNLKFDQFWSINRKLMDFGIEFSFRAIPLRVYVRSKSGFIQKHVRPYSTSNEPMKLLEYLTSIVDCLDMSVDDLEKSQLITHGIAIPPDTPLTWMSCHLSYPDNFIHLCIDRTVKES